MAGTQSTCKGFVRENWKSEVRHVELAVLCQGESLVRTPLESEELLNTWKWGSEEKGVLFQPLSLQDARRPPRPVGQTLLGRGAELHVVPLRSPLCRGPKGLAPGGHV